jgi:DNA topoisomerase-6 subunit A
MSKKEDEEIRKAEYETNQDVAKKLYSVMKTMVEQIEHNNTPTFTTKVRGQSNVKYNEDNRLLELGEKTTKRSFLNLGHARKFMQTSLILDRCYEYIKNNKSASIREIYYELKHTIANTKENTFDNQAESNDVIVDVEHAVNTIREKLNLQAEPKGALYGNVTLKDLKHDGDEFNCSTLGRGGWSIMSRIEPEEIKIKKVDADYLLVVETSAMYNRLIEERFPKNNRCILLSVGGQAARGARRLIHRLHYEANLPVIVFTDGDPYGWYIYSVIKQGSMALAAHSKFLAVPDAKYVGMTISDVEKYGLQKVTETLKEGGIKRAKEVMKYPWFQSEKWQYELKTAIKKKIRIEQQALANKSLEFVAETYLPEKINNKDFL